LLGRVQQVEAELAVRSHYNGVFGSLREIGDRMTGGGLRSLAKRIRALGDRITAGGLRSLAKRLLAALLHWAMRNRALLAMGRAVLQPFPKLMTNLYQLATTPDSDAIPSPSRPPSAPPPQSSQIDVVRSHDDEELAKLPASARPIYRRLSAAVSDSNGWGRTQ
jgi:hypothetical protein